MQSLIELMALLTPVTPPAPNGSTLELSARTRGRVNEGTTAENTRRFRVELDKYSFDEGSIATVLADLKGIAEIVAANEAEAVELVHAVQRGDIDAANRIARSIGLTEEELLRRGGGLPFFVLFVAAVAIVLVSAESISVESEPPPPDPQLDAAIEEIPPTAIEDAESYLGDD